MRRRRPFHYDDNDCVDGGVAVLLVVVLLHWGLLGQVQSDLLTRF